MIRQWGGYVKTKETGPEEPMGNHASGKRLGKRCGPGRKPKTGSHLRVGCNYPGGRQAYEEQLLRLVKKSEKTRPGSHQGGGTESFCYVGGVARSILVKGVETNEAGVGQPTREKKKEKKKKKKKRKKKKKKKKKKKGKEKKKKKKKKKKKEEKGKKEPIP